MTLLLGAICQEGLVVMSDGLCRQLKSDGTSNVLSTNQLKLFPLTSHRIVLAHHGQNVLDGCPISAVIGKLDEIITDCTTSDSVCADIQSHLDSIVIKTLTKLPPGIQDGCGLWIAGFVNGESKPLFTELFWKNGAKCKQTDFHVFARGGDGKKYCKAAQAKWTKFIFKSSSNSWHLKRWDETIRQLYKAATEEADAGTVFGGSTKIFWITPTNVADKT